MGLSFMCLAPLAKLYQAHEALHTTTFLGLSVKFPTPVLATSAKFVTAKFTTVKWTRHEIPPLCFQKFKIVCGGTDMCSNCYSWIPFTP